MTTIAGAWLPAPASITAALSRTAGLLVITVCAFASPATLIAIASAATELEAFRTGVSEPVLIFCCVLAMR